MSVRRILLFIVSVLFLAGHGAVAALSPAAAKVVYRISGVAVSARDGAPVPFCRIELFLSTQAPPGVQAGALGRGAGFGGQIRSRLGSQGLAETRADAHGRFELEAPGAGKWRLRAAARGFRLQDYEEHDDFYSDVVLSSASPAIELTFRLVPDGAILGLITDETGDPVSNAQVFAEMVGDGSAGGGNRRVGFAGSDDRGRYELSGLAPGMYKLRVQAQPWYAQGRGRPAQGNAGTADPGLPQDPSLDVVYPTAWFPGVEDERQAETIVLGKGEERQADFHMTPIPATHLRIPLASAADPTGEAVEGRPQRRQVSIVRVSPPGGFGESFSTTDGRTTDFGGLTPGLYVIHQTGPDGREAGEVRQIRVLPGGAAVLDLNSAQTLARVRIDVEGVPPEQVGEILFTDLDSGREITTAGGPRNPFRRTGGLVNQEDEDDGRSVFLAPGRYRVSLGPGGPNFLTGLSATGAKVTGFVLEFADGTPAVKLQVASGKGELRGVATLGGKPAASAMVLLVPVTLGQPDNAVAVQREETNTDGSFALEEVIPGRYILAVIQNGWGLNWHDPATLAQYLAHGAPVELKASARMHQDVTAQTP